MQPQQQKSEQKGSIECISPTDIGLPDKINGMRIKHISWSDFKGKVPKTSPYSAHIYWSIEYEIHNHKPSFKKQHYVTVEVRVSPKSWVKADKKSPGLLMHQYGHYLIGCICALSFQKKVNEEFRQPLTFNFNEWCYSIFRDTLNEHLKIEKKYDDITDHRLNEGKQQEWEKLIIKNLHEINAQNQKDSSKSKVNKSEKCISIETNDESTNGRERSSSSLSEYCKNRNRDKQGQQRNESSRRKDFSIHRLPSIPRPKEARMLPNLKKEPSFKRQSNKTLL